MEVYETGADFWTHIAEFTKTLSPNDIMLISTFNLYSAVGNWPKFPKPIYKMNNIQTVLHAANNCRSVILVGSNASINKERKRIDHYWPNLYVLYKDGQHSKIVYIEKDKKKYLWTGSANASDSSSDEAMLREYDEDTIDYMAKYFAKLCKKSKRMVMHET